MIVLFSELAREGLQRSIEDKALRENVERLLEWKLVRDSGFPSRRCPAFPDRQIRVGKLFAGRDFRIVYEVADELTIWSFGIAPKG